MTNRFNFLKKLSIGTASVPLLAMVPVAAEAKVPETYWIAFGTIAGKWTASARFINIPSGEEIDTLIANGFDRLTYIYLGKTRLQVPLEGGSVPKGWHYTLRNIKFLLPQG